MAYRPKEYRAKSAIASLTVEGCKVVDFLSELLFTDCFVSGTLIGSIIDKVQDLKINLSFRNKENGSNVL